MDIEEAHIGRRVREVRNWRQMSLTATAGLAGISTGYLSLIERGLRPVTKRALLEDLASALKVSPTELTGKPYAPTDTASADSQAAMSAVEDVLTGWCVGEIPDIPRRLWPDVQRDLERLNSVLRPRADYAAEAKLLPGLIRDLLAAVADPHTRRAALAGMLEAYFAAGAVAYRLGFFGLPAVAVERMRQAAEMLDDPAWRNFAAWARAHMLSGTNRSRQYELAVTVADTRDAPPEARGMANLTAALAAATQGNGEVSETHLTEAAALAELIADDVSPWGHLEFGRTNVGIWRVAIGVELGHGARVAEIASTIRPATVTQSRQAQYFTDYGRALLSERKTRDVGLTALLRAEQLAPQQLRNNMFVREAVSGTLISARRDAGGRELRGLASRLGVAPN